MAVHGQSGKSHQSGEEGIVDTDAANTAAIMMTRAKLS
jgi:hypothetical protein